MKKLSEIIFPVITLLLLQQFAACSKSGSGGSGNTNTPSPDSVSTVAGNGTAGFVNGMALNAEFNSPNGVAVDAQGNLYVGDRVNNCIRKISTTGVVTTFAGTGEAGAVDGPAASAEFNNPEGLAVDAQGNVYVADAGNEIIRKITAAGVVSTLAGNGTAGYVDGQAAGAEFYGPDRVELDAQGNIYVADYVNDRIRKITPAGIVSTVAGNGTAGFADGPATSAELRPDGLAIDAQGNIYVADYLNNRIRMVSAAGIVSTIAGNGTAGFADGSASAAEFMGPSGVVLDAQGNLYIADQEGNRVRKLTPAGMVSTVAGNGITGHTDGTFTNAEFNNPRTIAIDAQGNLYVADFSNNCIRKITLQ